MKNLSTGLKRILKAFVYSAQGFRAVFKTEAAFRQDLFVFISGILVSCFLTLTIVERVLMISALFFILLMELVNTAVEVIIDRISPEYHPLSGKAKDIGSLLVLIAFIHAIVIWSLILIQAI